jgi:predicted ATP-dependent protease
MLRKDVIEAVKQKKFHIWAIETIDEGIEILTGKSAGKRNKDGQFPKGTIHFLANQKLQMFAEQMKNFSPTL